MKLKIVAVGSRMPAWSDTATREYLKRLTAPVSADLQEVAAAKRSKNPDIQRIKSEEGNRILQAVPAQAVSNSSQQDC